MLARPRRGKQLRSPKNIMAHVYVLRSQKDNKRYVGMTNDVEKRLEQHQSGKVKSTKNRRPLQLVYTEEFETREEASKKELFFKSGKGREYLKSKNL